MTVEAAVVGTPFLDVVFEGMPRVPAIGEEVVGRSLHVVPGGSAIQAIGLARLGIAVALVAPRGRDVGGRVIGEVLDREGVAWIGPDTERTPTTAVLSTGDGAAMATAPGAGEADVATVESLHPARVVLSLGRAELRPPGVPACFVTGSVELEAGATIPPSADPERDLLVLNGSEAEALTGRRDPDEAARSLADRLAAVFVTLGREGAIAVRGGEVARAAAPTIEIVDATGAGDLFVSAIVWGETRGLPLADALAWACLFAGLSVEAPTALAGGRRLDDLLAEGRRRGLSPP
jgi:sugar/nucleoside kinase (ribokinase family)